MNRINTSQAKTNLSRYLRRVRRGETFILCHRNVPVAEIRPLPVVPRTRRRIGLLRGFFTVPPGFFAPLPEEILAGFEATATESVGATSEG